MPLSFVGLGLTPKDLSIRALETIAAADAVFGEAYTTRIPDKSRSDLEQILTREITWLERKDLEDFADQFIMKAKSANIVLLVGGDPFIATTHISLRIRAVELDIPCDVIHAPSIYSVVGSIGLFNYKFGRSISIPFPEDGLLSEVSYDVIAQNQAINAHTLIFLDLKAPQNRFMTIREGLEILETLEEKKRAHLFNSDTLVVGLAQAGTKSAIIRAGKLNQIKNAQFDVFPQALVIPSSLHFAEAEALVKLWGAPAEILNQ